MKITSFSLQISSLLSILHCIPQGVGVVISILGGLMRLWDLPKDTYQLVAALGAALGTRAP